MVDERLEAVAAQREGPGFYSRLFVCLSLWVFSSYSSYTQSPKNTCYWV